MKISKLIFEITNRCNLKCNMCGIWKDRRLKDMNTGTFEKALSLWKLSVVSLTGGEPFLTDIDKYYRIARSTFPKAWINISSNGYMIEEIASFFSSISDSRACATLSMDGLQSHDAIRGIRGSKERVLRTAAILKELGVETYMKITINPLNCNEIASTVRYLAESRYKVQLKVPENLQIYYGRNLDSEIILTESMISQITRQIDEINDYLDNRKYWQLVYSKITLNRTNCSWQENTCFVSLDGNIYICRKRKPIGIMARDSAERIRQNARLTPGAIKNCKKECYEFSSR